MKCDTKGIDIHDVLKKEIGENAYPIAISPLVNSQSQEVGVVLYYKEQ